MMSPPHADDGQTPRDEHARFQNYLNALMQVPDADETALVIEILGDPDQVMAEAAVVQHLDRQASALHLQPQYFTWAQKMTDALDGHPFAAQRLREWSLLRAITHDTPWNVDALTAASNWLQRKVVETAASPQALTVLAEAGRTRRVRNTAKSKINSKHQ
jgi:hypothetical protein